MNLNNNRIFTKEVPKKNKDGVSAVDFLRSVLETSTTERSLNRVEDRIDRLEGALARLLCLLYSDNKLTASEVLEIIGYSEWEHDEQKIELTKLEDDE